MKINLNEAMVRSLARNILFEANEKINLHELNMSPNPEGLGASKALNGKNPQSGNRTNISNRKGPNTSSIKKQKEFGEDEFNVNTDELPINDDNKFVANVNFEVTPNLYNVGNEKTGVTDRLNAKKGEYTPRGSNELANVVGKLSGEEISNKNIEKYYQDVISLINKYKKKQGEK
jgi:hypothetical protein